MRLVEPEIPFTHKEQNKPNKVRKQKQRHNKTQKHTANKQTNNETKLSALIINPTNSLGIVYWLVVLYNTSYKFTFSHLMVSKCHLEAIAGAMLDIQEKL